MKKLWRNCLLFLCMGIIGYENFSFALPQPSLAYQAGQVMMVGFDGTTINEQSPVVQQMKNYHIGGVIIFDHYTNYKYTGKSKTRNITSPTQLKYLTTQLQYYAKKYNVYPLLIAVNQEGGKITVLKPNKGFDLKLNYTQTALGKAHPELIFKQAYMTGKLLRKYGININLAPVAALNVNENNPAIGQLGRTFGNDPLTVGQDIITTMRAYKASGIACTLKHFPGMGSATANTDTKGIVDVSKTWSFDELVPYQKAILSDAMCPLVMTSHVINTQLESQTLPSSLSYAVVTQLLREKLHYTGVIITDAIDVNAITENFSLNEAVQLAVSAGNNVILYDGGRRTDPNADIQTIYTTLLTSAKHDSSFREKLFDSFKKVQQLKKIISTEEYS